VNELANARPSRHDFGFVFILLLILVIAGWLIAMPFSLFVQRTTLDRFHLQTRSFLGWAIQQPVPAMYNFYNHYEVRPSPWKSMSDDPLEEASSETGTINHFPVRIFTFGDNRSIFLAQPERRTLDAWSSYRGEVLHTRWTATPSVEAGGFDLVGEVVK
jgi:hypothetical protein